MKQHKHADVIKAWAYGAEVQVKFENSDWINSTDPVWFAEWEYRVKPAEKVVRWLWAFKYSNVWYTNNRYLTDAESKAWFKNHEATSSKKLEWSREEFDE